MGHNERPLFELIVEESRRKAWDVEGKAGGDEEESGAAMHVLAKNSPSKKAKVGWFSRGKKANIMTHDRPPTAAGSPTKCSSDYESANDSFSWPPLGYGGSVHFNIIEELLQGEVGLPCLQNDGHMYLELAMALDMMELRMAQACAERDAAIAQALDLRFAMDSLRNRLQQVEQYSLHLNYQLFMNSTKRPSR